MQQQVKQFEPMKERMVGMLFTDHQTSSGRKKINIQLHHVKVGNKTKKVDLFALEVNGRPGEYGIYRKDFDNTDVFAPNTQKPA